jgi:hypothetical protein
MGCIPFGATTLGASIYIPLCIFCFFWGVYFLYVFLYIFFLTIAQILGYSATYHFDGTVLIVDCYDSGNNDHFGVQDGSCGFVRTLWPFFLIPPFLESSFINSTPLTSNLQQRYRPIGYFFTSAVANSVQVSFETPSTHVRTRKRLAYTSAQIIHMQPVHKLLELM